MPDVSHENLDLTIEGAAGCYRVRVTGGPAGEAAAEAAWDITGEQIDSFLYRIGRPRQRTRRARDPVLDEARRFGARLHDAVFRGDVLANVERSLAAVDARGVGLRIRLRLAGAPDLADLPWEFLFSRARGRFLALSSDTPVVRYLDLGERIRPLPLAPPLQVLAVISSPNDYPRLDAEREWEHLSDALSPLAKRGLLRLDRLETPLPRTLNRRLSDEPIHVLHYIGHGAFDDAAEGGGELILQDERGRGRHVPAEEIAIILGGHRSLRLAVLNSCEGARASRTDPFAGTAQALVRQGLPAVIAMQFEITDAAAITFAEEFYASVAEGRPIDASLADARRAIFAKGDGVEWATPVLYLRAPDGRVFGVEGTSVAEDRERLASEGAGRAARDAADREARLSAREAEARQQPEEERRSAEGATAREEEERQARPRVEVAGEARRLPVEAAARPGALEPDDIVARLGRRLRLSAREFSSWEARQDEALRKVFARWQAKWGARARAGQEDALRQAEAAREREAAAAARAAPQGHRARAGVDGQPFDCRTSSTEPRGQDEAERRGEQKLRESGRAKRGLPPVAAFFVTIALGLSPVAIGVLISANQEAQRQTYAARLVERPASVPTYQPARPVPIPPLPVERPAPPPTYQPTRPVPPQPAAYFDPLRGNNPVNRTPDGQSWASANTCAPLLDETPSSWRSRYIRNVVPGTYMVLVHTVTEDAPYESPESTAYKVRDNFRAAFPTLEFQALLHVNPQGVLYRVVVVAAGIPPDRVDEAKRVCRLARSCVRSDAYIIQKDGRPPRC